MEEFLKIAASFGATGFFLGAVIFFIGRRLLRLEEAVDRLVRMELMRLIASPHVANEVKNQMETQLKEVEKSIEDRRN